jgi:hypothetical protein
LNEHQGAPARIVAAAMTPWLIRWVLLSDWHHYDQAPGEDEMIWIHVVCPERDCKNDAWVTAYEPGTVKQCGQHDGPRIPMEPCLLCQRRPGSHLKPEGGQ